MTATAILEPYIGPHGTRRTAAEQRADVLAGAGLPAHVERAKVGGYVVKVRMPWSDSVYTVATDEDLQLALLEAR